MPDPLWTLCRGCTQPVDVMVIPAEPHPDHPVGASWRYDCAACGWSSDADQADNDLDVSVDAPPPPDPLTVLLPALQRIGLERIATALGRSLSPIMDAVRAQPGLSHIKGTDYELLLEALRSREGWEPRQPRWSNVQHISGHGSGVGHALCVVIGVDPNEVCPDDDGETCPRCGSWLDDDEDEDAEE